MAAAHPSLPKEGANFGPIYKLINSRQDDDQWNPKLIGALKSVLANGQYTQQRCMAAGWVSHAKCIFCLHAAVTGQVIAAAMPSTRSVAAHDESAKQRENLERATESRRDDTRQQERAAASSEASGTRILILPSPPPPPLHHRPMKVRVKTK